MNSFFKASASLAVLSLQLFHHCFCPGCDSEEPCEGVQGCRLCRSHQGGTNAGQLVIRIFLLKKKNIVSISNLSYIFYPLAGLVCDTGGRPKDRGGRPAETQHCCLRLITPFSFTSDLVLRTGCRLRLWPLLDTVWMTLSWSLTVILVHKGGA